MMDLKQWEQAVKLHITAIELLLANVLEEKYTVSLDNIETGSNEEAATQIQQPGKVIRFVEGNFHSEVFLSFSEAWVTHLADHLAGTESKNEKILNELILEFSTNLTQAISGALADVGVDIELTNFEIIEPANLPKAFNLQQYFRANLKATPGNGDGETKPFLELRVAASHPDEKTVNSYKKIFEDENPFSDQRYVEAVNYYANHTEMNKTETTGGQEEYNSGVSTQGQNVEFEDFGKSGQVKNNREVRNIDILKDVEMDISVELGRREMPLGNILQLVKGSVIELEKLAGEPVEILVNGHTIAQGDVVVIDEHFGVRISNLLATKEHLKSLQ